MAFTMANTLSESVLRAACQLYPIKGTPTLIRDNSNLIFETEGIILRATHSSIRLQHEMQAELDWLDFLGSNGLDVVRIIPSIQNNNSEIVKDKNGYYTWVAFEKISGDTITSQQWDENHFEKLGQLTGQLHRIGKEYAFKDETTYLHWNEIMEHRVFRHLPADDRKLPELSKNVNQYLEQIPRNEKYYGLIHYDIHHGNYLFTPDNKLILFDFEMTCLSWYINDIAAVIFYSMYFPFNGNQKTYIAYFLSAFRKGYEKEYDILESELKYIPHFLLYRYLMVYAFLLHIWRDKTLSESEKKYLDRMEKGIEYWRMELEY